MKTHTTEGPSAQKVEIASANARRSRRIRSALLSVFAVLSPTRSFARQNEGQVELEIIGELAKTPPVQAINECPSIFPDRESLQCVLDAVNRNTTFATDWENYGREDQWVVNPFPREGEELPRMDCEDWTLTTLASLHMEKGVSKEDLQLAVVRVRGVLHAVALVYDRFLLDSLSPHVLSANRYEILQTYSYDAAMARAFFSLGS